MRNPLVLLLACLAASSFTARAAAKSEPVPAELTFRELRYQGALSDAGARFTVTIDAESTGRGDAKVVLFEGDLAVPAQKLPANLRLTREGPRYWLTATRAGRYQFQLELTARVTRSEPWNQIEFTGPIAGIAAVVAEARGDGVELELLKGTVAESTNRPVAQLKGFLGAERVVALRWQGQRAETTRKSLLTCETTGAVHITPLAVKLDTQFRFEVLQARRSRLLIGLPTGQALTKVEGEHIRDWQIQAGDAAGFPEQAQVLTVELLKPIEQSYALTLHTEQSLDALPFHGTLPFPQPLEVERESGFVTVAALDTVAETSPAAGLQQVNAPEGSLAAYRYFARPAVMQLAIRRVEPVITAADRVTARLEESRLLVQHALAVSVEKAGVYALELETPAGFTVAEVRGEGVEDWKLRGGRLAITFGSRLLGARALDIQLEQSLRAFPEQLAVLPLRVVGAERQTAQIGAVAAPGIRLKTAEVSAAREIPVANLPQRAEEALAFVADQPDWSLKLACERLTPRVVAEVFHLITVGDGLVGGSATVRYALVNQGVQEFRLRLPAHWKNVDFTGPNIRRKDQQGDVWTLTLQDKVWGGYTLVVTYDESFDPHQATLQLGGLHALGVERETGSIAVTAAASLQLKEKTATGPLRRIDEADLAETDRALITRSVLLAYRISAAEPYELAADVSRFQELPVLQAVADRTQLTTVLTASGEMLTQAAYQVKNNDKPYQRFTLPRGAEFWSCQVDGQPVKTVREGDDLLVPLPRGANRDHAFPIEIVYAQKAAALKSHWWQRVGLEAPRTDVQTTYAEWEFYVPEDHGLRGFTGSFTPPAELSYGWREARAEFLRICRGVLRSGGLLPALAVALVLGLVVWLGVRRSWLAAAASLALIVVLAGMLLPALSKAKSKSMSVAHFAANEPAAASAPAPTQMVTDLAAVEAMPRLEEQLAENEAKATVATVDALSLADKPAALGRELVLSKRAAARPTAQLAYGVKADGDRKAGRGAFQSEARGLGGLAGGGVAAIAKVVGLRPIRVDIPRSGRRFLFTKVLNVRDDKLQLSAVVFGEMLYRVARTGAQAVVFLAGIALAWMQLRAAKPRPALAALGVCLALGGVVAMLLTTRLLGVAMVIATALLPLAIVLWVARRLWLHRPKRAQETKDASAPGAAPAAAVTLLLLALGASQTLAEEMPVVAPPPAPTNSVSILSAEYTGVVQGKVARVEATFKISVARANELVRLFGDDIAVEALAQLPKDARVVRDANGVSVRFARVGEATLKLSFLVKPGTDPAGVGRHLAFAIPPALSSRVALALDEAEASLEFPTAVEFHSAAQDGRTRVEGVIGAGERVDVRWTPRTKRAGEIAATVFCQNTVLATFRGAGMNLRSTLDYQVTQGELRALRVRLPAGQHLLRVEGEAIRTWQLQEADTAPVLLVELTRAIGTNYFLKLETEQAIAAWPMNLAVETPHALDVRRETGWLAVRSAEELGVTVESSAGLQQMDPIEFCKHAPDAGALAGAFQFLKPDFALRARVEPLQPEIEAVARHHVRIGPEQITLQTDVDYTIKRAGVFALQLELPAGYRLDAVRSGDITPSWSEQNEGGRRVLHVAFKQRTLGAYPLRLTLVRALNEAPRSVAIETARPLGARKLTGFVVVSSEPGLQVKTRALEGLTEVPAASVPGGAAGLAYKFLRAEAEAAPTWQLAVAVESVEAWVRAEIANWLTVTDNLVTGRALVRFDVQNAPVKEFRVRVPREFRNVEVSGDNLRRRDETNGVWRVELQNRVLGAYVLTVTWEQSARVNETASALAFDGVQALDVERETGFLAVVARPPLQVTVSSAGEELVALDASELPAWTGVSDPPPTLAWRYLRPGYQLKLAAQQHQQAAVLQALADSARLTTVVADDGQMMTEFVLSVRNNGRQFLEIALPPGARVWSAFVAGQAVRPTQKGERLLLPLERSTSDDAPIPVELTYVTTQAFPAGRGAVALVSPALDVPLKDAHWELFLPADYSYARWDGTLTRVEETDIGRVVAFTSSDYSKAEATQQLARERDAVQAIERARGQLSSGKLKEATRELSQARAYGSRADAADEAVKLGVELRRAQSSNLLNAQQSVIDNNAYFFKDMAGVSVAGQAGAYDAETAGRQWEKLQQAQEIAAVTVKPLRVHLPKNGVRFAFSQVLQTEIGKPMQLSFTAANLRTPSWPARGLAALGLFGALWAGTGVALRSRQTA